MGARSGWSGRAGLAASLMALVAACGEEPTAAVPAVPDETALSRDARPETTELLKEDLAARRDPSDGGGRAWIEAPEPVGDRPRLPAGEPARIAIVYEAGPLGIVEGGLLFLQISPFWNWETPQTRYPDGPAYTEVATDASGVELESLTADRQLLAIRIGGRKLESGERIRIVYGAGSRGARIDTYAERRAAIWLAVDGDGDGLRALIPDPPEIDIVPGPPARLLLTLSSEARPGEPIQLTAAVTDRVANAGLDVVGEIRLAVPDGLELPDRLALTTTQRGAIRVAGVARTPGVYRLRGEIAIDGGEPIAAESNPLVVRDDADGLLWADVHGHSNLSDGTGTPEDYFAYARDVAGLDVVALTDHDHWGMEFLDAHPELWERIVSAVERFHEPGRFVTILGYEWTSWLHGHRHVLHFGKNGAIYSSIDPRYETPTQLWDALRGQPALTFAHHSAGGPISTNWRFAPDPELEPVTEITSTHGSSEALDSPGLIYSALEGNTVRDVLDRGFRLGFIGSGDSHDGHPGLVQLGTPGGNGGLAALRTGERTRDGVLAALRARRVYATNGPRIWLRASVDGAPIGSVLPAGRHRGDSQVIDFECVATAPLERLDVIRSGAVAQSYPGEGLLEWSGRIEMPSLASGEYVYLRFVQEDGGTAWSSPVWAD